MFFEVNIMSKVENCWRDFVKFLMYGICLVWFLGKENYINCLIFVNIVGILMLIV